MIVLLPVDTGMRSKLDQAMGLRALLGMLLGLVPVLVFACESDEATTPCDCTSAAGGSGGGPVADAAADASDASDPGCATQPVAFGLHPKAAMQGTADGRALIDVRGWHDRLYFGYGDLVSNTGPIWISSLDPVTKVWQDHLEFPTEQIQRFRVIGDSLYAPSADPHGAEPQPDVAIGTAAHEWSALDVGESLHVFDAVERAPGDIYLVGGGWLDQANGFVSGYVWRSQDGAPFALIFPVLPIDPVVQLFNVGRQFYGAAALDGILYPSPGGAAWSFDGTTWSFGTVVGAFLRPTTFADRIVFDNFGQLWALDGQTKKNLGVTLIPNPASYQFVAEPNSVFSDTEGHLVAVAANGSVLETTDLETWTCIGQAPAYVTSVGSLNGRVYFGAAEGKIWGYEAPSW